MNNRWRNKKKLAKYTFSKKEIYEADHTMATFILAVLKEYKKADRMGYPGFDEADTSEKWEALIDRLIWTFDQLVHDYPDSPAEIARNKMYRDNPNTIVFFNQCITDEVKEKELKYRAYVQEGLMLYGKFFQTFWD